MRFSLTKQICKPTSSGDCPSGSKHAFDVQRHDQEEHHCIILYCTMASPVPYAAQAVFVQCMCSACHAGGFLSANVEILSDPRWSKVLQDHSAGSCKAPSKCGSLEQKAKDPAGSPSVSWISSELGESNRQPNYQNQYSLHCRGLAGLG